MKTSPIHVCLLFRVFLSALLLGMVLPFDAEAVSQEDPAGPGSGGNTVHFLYPSLLNATLTVTPVGGVSYDYQVNFVNTDASELWHFMVWTEEPAISYSGSFTSVHSSSLDAVIATYDPRNLDPNLTSRVSMNYPAPWPSTGLPVGESGQLNFNLSGYYDTFIYGYETVDSGYAVDNGGFLAAVGTAVIPEPTTLTLLSLGSLALVMARRRR